MSELSRIEDITGRLRALLLQLDGTSESPGIIQLLDGDDNKLGLISQAHHTAVLLKELMDRREGATDLFEPGEVQDAKIEALRRRLSAVLSAEVRETSVPLIDAIQAAAGEVLSSLTRTRSESAEMQEQVQAQRHELQESFESISVRFEEVISRVAEVCEQLDRISTIDTALLSREVQEATDDAFKEGVALFRKADREWLVDLISQKDASMVQRLQTAIEGQNIVFEDQFMRGRAELARAIEGSTYAEVLSKLNKQLSSKETEVQKLKAELASKAATNGSPGNPRHLAKPIDGVLIAGAILVGAVVAIAGNAVSPIVLAILSN